MTYKYTKLTDKVLEQIKKDVEAGDMTSIEALINEVTENNQQEDKQNPMLSYSQSLG